MTKLDMLTILETLPDETVIVIQAGEVEEGEYYAAGEALQGVCDPKDNRVDGYYLELGKTDHRAGERNVGGDKFPVLALHYETSNPRNVFME